MPAGPESTPPTPASDDETLAERVQRGGPLQADIAWTLACRLLDALESLHATGSVHGDLSPENILLPIDLEADLPPTFLHPGASPSADPRDDLTQIGVALWFALTGTAPATPPDWAQLDPAGLTPESGALPVLLARMLTGDPASRPASVPALRNTLKMLASLREAVPVCAGMPTRASGPDPSAPLPDGHPAAPADSELWTRAPAQLAARNRRRHDSTHVWNTLILLAAGGAAGFFGGVLYEKSQTPRAFSHVSTPVPAFSPSAAALPKAAVAPTPVALAPAQPVGPGGVAARLERISTLQPDVRDVLKYTRELRRVATLPVTDPAFPSDAELSALVARFDWTAPESPGTRRTPLLLVLGYDEAGAEPSQALAEAMLQGLARGKIKTPVYTCGMGAAARLSEVQSEGVNSGQFVEVWVAFTLF